MVEEEAGGGNPMEGKVRARGVVRSMVYGDTAAAPR